MPNVCSEWVQHHIMAQTNRPMISFWNVLFLLAISFLVLGMVSTTSQYIPKNLRKDSYLGVQLILYISCALFLWNVRKSRGRQSIFLLGYITLLLIIETIFAAVQSRTVQDIYIDNRNYPGGPWAYFLATQYLPINVMFYATLFVLTFLADLLVVRMIKYISDHSPTLQSSYGDAGLSGVGLESWLRMLLSLSLHSCYWHLLVSASPHNLNWPPSLDSP